MPEKNGRKVSVGKSNVCQDNAVNTWITVEKITVSKKTGGLYHTNQPWSIQDKIPSRPPSVIPAKPVPDICYRGAGIQESPHSAQICRRRLGLPLDSR